MLGTLGGGKGITPKVGKMKKITSPHGLTTGIDKFWFWGELDQIIEEVVTLGSDLDFELNTQNVKQYLQFDERRLSSED